MLGVNSTAGPAGPSLYRRSTSKIEFAARYATAGLRPLPDFVIIGAQRSGTTSLYRWLTTRPDVMPAWKKEVHYFDNHYDQSLRWYRAHFPMQRLGQMTGESTPYLMFHPLAPARAAWDLPEARFIAILRDPVERAISNHWLRRRIGAAQNETLDDALAKESAILHEESEKVLRGEVSLRHMAYSYVARGEYASQLRRWFDAVGRERVLVIESERISVERSAALQVLGWLGLPDRGDPFPVMNQAQRDDDVSPEVVARLRAHFEPHNQALFELLGYELWKNQPAAPDSKSS